jgi:hypothetical protein
LLCKVLGEVPRRTDRVFEWTASSLISHYFSLRSSMCNMIHHLKVLFFFGSISSFFSRLAFGLAGTICPFVELASSKPLSTDGLRSAQYARWFTLFQYLILVKLQAFRLRPRFSVYVRIFVSTRSPHDQLVQSVYIRCGAAYAPTSLMLCSLH